MRFRDKQPRKIGIDITPLIDVIFLLLIFFMVSTTFVDNPGIEVNLPKAESQSVATKPETLEITIDHSHRLYLKSQMIDKAELWARLEEHKKNKGPLPVIIRADSAVRHEMVVYVMDQARKAGLLELSIATLEAR